jgi:thioesterase domain-containing protein
MTHHIFGTVAPTDHSHIVPFRTSGASSPLFCFPGSGGNAHAFQEMAAAIPEGHPVYAIDMQRLCDLKQDFTVEQLAAFYIDVVRTIQRNGPYYLCGYSFGGLVAYEIAMRLIDQGHSVGLVALLDAPNPALMSNLSKIESMQFRKTYLIDRLKAYGLQLVRGQLQAFVSRGLAFIVSRGGAIIWPLIKTGFQMMQRPLPGILRANDPGFVKAERSYVPRRYPKSLVCVRAQDRGAEYDRDPSMGWENCAMGGVEVHVVPGDHVDMMKMPNVRTVADLLATYLDGGRAAGRAG